ncbi:MAG: squalene/phytoene synthase family protein, partial [Alphaproteobacteria bacterium]
MTWSYCAQTVKERDPARFLVTLNQRKSVQESIFALLAFNCEISKTSSYVSNEMLGHIRFQWWREAIEEIYSSKEDQKNVRKHEVVQALFLLRKTLPQNLLIHLIDVHVQDLTNEQFVSVEGLEKYAADTEGTITRLIGYILEAEPDGTSERALNHLGASWYLSGLALDSSKREIECSKELDCEVIAREAWKHLESSKQADLNEFAAYSAFITSRLKALSRAGYN